MTPKVSKDGAGVVCGGGRGGTFGSGTSHGTGRGHSWLAVLDVQALNVAVGDLAMAADQSSGRVQVSIDGPAVADLESYTLGV